ncbi:hypothetical protein [Asticcacaulis sp. W401b]|uniref:hypothetical protein n=1 Tax=Asticcacaulis sp. W401b TaxID=3388666 RepID=UPI00397067D9
MVRNPQFLDRVVFFVAFVRVSRSGYNRFANFWTKLGERFGVRLPKIYWTKTRSKANVGVNRQTWEDVTASRSPVVITVHGTGDGDDTFDLNGVSAFDDEGKKWWQRNGDFRKEVETHLEGEKPGWLPFHWSGENSEFDRQRAAKGLAKVVGSLAQRSIPYIILAHSHGGNVVDLAIKIHPSVCGEAEYCRAIISYGTPFFRRSEEKKFSAKILEVALEIFKFSIFILAINIISFFVRILFIGEEYTNIYYAILLITGMFYLFYYYIDVNKHHTSINIWKERIEAIWHPIVSHRDEAIGFLSLFSRENFSNNKKYLFSRLIKLKISFNLITKIFVSKFNEYSNFFILYASIISVFIIRKDKAISSEENKLNTFLFSIDFSTYQFETNEIFLYFISFGSFYIDVCISYILIFALCAFFYFLLKVLFLFERLSAGIFFSMSSSIAFGDDGFFQVNSIGETPEHMPCRPVLLINRNDFGDLSEYRLMTSRDFIYTSVIELRSLKTLIDKPDDFIKSFFEGIYHNAYFKDSEVVKITSNITNDGLSGNFSL